MNKFSRRVVSNRNLHTVVMVRHGESLWNLEKRFTGWCNVPLTAAGEADAKDAGILMGERGLHFDIAFTSSLERAWRTCAIILSSAGQSGVETVRSWRLNERHYGALQGQLKDSPHLTKVFGEDKLMEWRKSYDVAPPSLIDTDFINKIGSSYYNNMLNRIDPDYLDAAMSSLLNKHSQMSKYSPLVSSHSSSASFWNSIDRHTLKVDLPIERNMINHSFTSYPSSSSSPWVSRPIPNLHPLTESLKQCEERAYGYWKHIIAPQVRKGKRVLIVAHANTIRAMVKSIDGIRDDQIAKLKVPNGIPLVYTLNDNLEPVDLEDDLGFQANYLVSARNHAKMMAYERCTQKKLRSLFEYLDTDGDGRITLRCLQNGINKLNYQSQRGGGDSTDMLAAGNDINCEFEVEELLRCIPQADELGGVTLQEFLDSEATVLHKLSSLRLLQ